MGYFKKSGGKMTYYEDLSRQEINSFKKQQESTVECPKCKSPLRAETRDNGMKFICMNLTTCNYTRLEPWVR